MGSPLESLSEQHITHRLDDVPEPDAMRRALGMARDILARLKNVQAVAATDAKPVADEFSERESSDFDLTTEVDFDENGPNLTF